MAYQTRGERGAGDEIDDVLEVLAKAEALHPRLVARREALAAEIGQLDAALAKLGSVIGGSGSRESRERGAAHRHRRSAGSRSLDRVNTRRSAGPRPRVGDLVLKVLAKASDPIGAAEIADGLRGLGRPTSAHSLQVVLRTLREQGHVRASGKVKRFKYELGSSVVRDP